MNPELRRKVYGRFADAGVAFAEQEVLAFDSTGAFCKVSDADAQGVAGFTGRAFKSADVKTTEDMEFWTGYIDLLNDTGEGAIGLEHIRGLRPIYFRDGLTVTASIDRACSRTLIVAGVTLAEGGKFVTINASPPGAS